MCFRVNRWSKSTDVANVWPVSTPPLTLAAACLIGALLGACVPIPTGEGYASGSRGNLAEKAPEFIIPGKTTREEVLVELGQANRTEVDGSLVCYQSALQRGGTLLMGVMPRPFPGVGSADVEFRRLVVFFAKSGVVERVQFERVFCNEVTAFGGMVQRKCFDAAGKEIVPSTNYPTTWLAIPCEVPQIAAVTRP